MNEDNEFTVVDVEDIGTHAFLKIENRTVRGPTGETAKRIVIVHPGAVAIVGLIGDDLIMVDQYRTPVDRNVLELPAGKIDNSDTSTLDAARRELLEETGYEAATMTELTSILTAVGFTDERITIYLAEGLTPGEAEPDGIEEYAAGVVRIPFTEAVRRVVAGEIQDAKSIAGIMLTDARRRGQ